MKTTTTILGLTLTQSFGATIWESSDNALDSASWDIFSFSSPTAGDSGSHGASQVPGGGLITTSDLSTEITQSYTTPPGGFLGNPDTYYFHDGAATWTGSLDLLSGVSHVRVSIALLGFGGGAPDPYGQSPTISGATLIDDGTYDTATNTVYYYDLALGASSTSIATTFGDSLFPGFPGSFRSVDSVQMEVFNATPAPVPEPSAPLLASVASLFLLRRKRTR